MRVTLPLRWNPVVTGVRRRRIAVSSFYLPSESKIGAGWMAHRLANALVRIGHDVTMFSPCVRPDDALYEHAWVPMEGSLRTFRWALRVREIDFQRFDALLAQGDDHLVPRGAVGAHIRTLHGSCFYEAIHSTGVVGRIRMGALGLTELASAVRVPDVVGVSKNSLRPFPWRRTVIPNGVDLERFRPADRDEKDPLPTILFVGTFGRRKRGWLLQETFARYVRPRIPNAQLWMVCDDAPGAPGVHVLGRISDDELADRYRRAWVFCLPSTYEGFGVPYAEAMVSGTAVVASANPGSREVLRDGLDGVLAPDAQLGRAIVRLLVDSNAREELEARGLARRAEFDFLDIARRYTELVERQLT